MSNFLDGLICESCAETTRQGRDNTSRALKARRRADLLQVSSLEGISAHLSADAQAYEIASGQLMAEELHERLPAVSMGSGGEAIKPEAGGLINTLTEPTVAALEASSHRADLITMLGNDIAAMALDAADTIQADNSLEKMLAHQLAAIHHASMHMVHRANLMQDAALAAKTLNTALKGFAAFQGGLGALSHLQGRQRQHIVVQHVNVGAGGQAVVGSVNTQGGGARRD